MPLFILKGKSGFDGEYPLSEIERVEVKQAYEVLSPDEIADRDLAKHVSLIIIKIRGRDPIMLRAKEYVIMFDCGEEEVPS